MWTVALMGLAGLLAGGAISLRRQEKPRLLVAAFWIVAAMAVVVGWLLTLPESG
ncbi:hypothetical protein [Arthrobacter castelli]|uniref:hypothetical protein n=1 Tax=Arthrobacter castelli TaxID=271431 RepID=UPI0004081230|nr:hypothetical protein [Arthrobacter castelli]